MSESFYGTGESFLFQTKPQFKIYNWSGENLHFARSVNFHGFLRILLHLSGLLGCRQKNLRNVNCIFVTHGACFRGNVDSLSFGAGEGQFGLYLDSSLYQGRSQSCSTFNNQPLVPGGDKYYSVVNKEGQKVESCQIGEKCMFIF